MNKQIRKMSSKQYNKIYAKRGYNYLTCCEVSYVDKDTILTNHKSNLLCKLLAITFSPLVYILTILVYGISGLGDCNEAFIDILKSKSISKDVTYRRNIESWELLSNYIDTGVITKTTEKG